MLRTVFLDIPAFYFYIMSKSKINYIKTMYQKWGRNHFIVH